MVFRLRIVDILRNDIAVPFTTLFGRLYDEQRLELASAVGIGADRQVIADRTPVVPGSSLFLFSDGVFEITDQDGRDWGLSEVMSLLPIMAAPNGPRRLYDAVRKAARPGPLDEDFSALALKFS